MQTENKKRIGIIRGGQGENYTSSLKRGGDIIFHIHENLGDKYKVSDILIDKDGAWHLAGMPIQPADLIHKVDVVWNTTNPNISAILENLSIPHIGISHFSSTLENNQEMLCEHMKNIGVTMPKSVVLPVYQPDFDGLREKYVIKKAKEVLQRET